MPELSRDELGEIYAFAVDLGKAAGQILLDAAQLRYGGERSQEQAHVEKLNAVDLVTQTDEGMYFLLLLCPKVVISSWIWRVDQGSHTVHLFSVVLLFTRRYLLHKLRFPISILRCFHASIEHNSLSVPCRRGSFHQGSDCGNVPLSQVSSSPCCNLRPYRVFQGVPDRQALMGCTSRFLGEETYSKGSSRDYLIDDQPTWCVDPLDGKPKIYM